ncbi:MAG: class I SAM-dependent methyltransferase, partial [Planctomycetaceae bacterium]|nr:class I SAM-dependent methyltransferase [Planctomycetaceae bacterium]
PALTATAGPEPVTEVNRRCVCGNARLIDLGACREPGIGARGTTLEGELSVRFEAGRLYRCEQCYLGLRLPCPDPDALESLYRNLPATRWQNGLLRGSAQQYLVKRLSQQQGLRILDVGAFDGTFLSALPDSFQKFAIEPSDAAVLLEELGIRNLKSFLQAPTPEEAASFDVVTMFDVFEHLSDPLQGMQNLMGYVRPGGTLFVGTGNLDHWSWRPNAGGHWYVDPIQHVVFGSRRHFAWQAVRLKAARFSCQAFSHHRGSVRQQISQALTTLYFGMRNQSGWRRMAVRLMNSSAFFRSLSHKDAMPYAQQLHDHLLAEFVCGEALR